MSVVGRRILELRKARGWNQVELAAYSGVSPATINLAEHGRRNPSTTTLQKLADALEVEPGDFFTSPKVEAPSPLTPAEETVSGEERRFSDSGEDRADQFILDTFDLMRRKAQAAMADWRSRSDALTSAEVGYGVGSACYREAARIIELSSEVIQKLADDVSPLTVKAVHLMRDALLDDLRQAVKYVHNRVVQLEQNEAPLGEHYFEPAVTPLAQESEHLSEHLVDEIAQRRQMQAELKRIEERDSGHVLEQIAAEHGK